jgi:dTDP-4-dehydrorhamnose reductase
MRLYVTGGTGFLGSNIIKVATERYGAEVFTTVHSWQADQPVNFEYGQVDIRWRDQVFASVRRYKPEAIIHSAILSDFALMYRDRHLAWQAYVDATRHLTEAANEVGAKMILVSTDWVFDGTQSGADETTPPNPVNLYGVLKVVGETIVRETAHNGAVARVSGVNGMHWTWPDEPRPQNPGFGHFMTAVIDALQEDQPFHVWEGDLNMVATPSLASESAELMMRIIQKDKQGTFHCCGGESIARMELAHATAEVFELDAGLIHSSEPEWGDLAGIPIPRDTSLTAVETAGQLDYELPTVRQILQTYRHQLETGTL